MKPIRNIAPVVQVSAGSAQDIRGQIATVMDKYPELSAYGFHFSAPGDWQDVARYKAERAQMQTASFIDQVETCIEALTTPRTRRNAWKVERHSSYVLKHMVERWAEEIKRDDVTRYVSNGAFIVAAVIDGWAPVRLERSPNCGFRREVAR